MKVIKILCFGLFLSAACFGQGKWTRMSDIPGVGRYKGVSFVIDNFAYVGTGSSTNDFWKYDPLNNSWSQIADFSGEARHSAFGFAIGTNGFVGGGSGKSDFWQYNSLINTWTRKTDIGGGIHAAGVGFSIDDKGYIGMGFDQNGNHRDDFWQYDPVLDKWTQKQDYPGEGRGYLLGFVLNKKAYIGSGYNHEIGIRKDFWQYNPVDDSWLKKKDLDFNPYSALAIAGVSATDKKGYVYFTNGVILREYNYLTDEWFSKRTMDEVNPRETFAFSVYGKFYIIGGYCGVSACNSLWQFDPNFIPSLTTLTATNVSTSSIDLSWNDETTDGEKYEIYRSTTSGSGFSKIAEVAKDTINYTDTGLVANTTYYYKVKTVNITEGFASDFSNEANATTSLSANISLQAYSYSQSEIRLVWSTDNTSVDGYKIERSDDESKSYSEVAEVPVGSAAGYIDNNLTLGKTYFYRIRAFKGNSFSQYSNRIGANTKPTSLNETLSQKIKVLNNPNPTGIFRVKAEGASIQGWEAELRDGQMKALPQNLIQKTNVGYQIDLSQYPAGVYFLIFKTNNGQVIKKLIRL